jgi:hypothetical protein
LKRRRSHPVEKAEVQGLSELSLHLRDLLEPEDRLRREGVEVLTADKRLTETLVTADLRRDAKFNLGEVRRHQRMAGFRADAGSVALVAGQSL